MSTWRVIIVQGQYGLLAMILHWLSAIIIIALLMGGFVMAGYVLGSKIWAWYGLHSKWGWSCLAFQCCVSGIVTLVLESGQRACGFIWPYMAAYY